MFGRAMKENNPLDSFRFSMGILILLLAVIVALWCWLPGQLAGDSATLEHRGQLGDSYGSVNALFTGLAFAGLIFTILLQHREIRLQRADFAAQIEEMRQSREEIVRQVNVQTLQLQVAMVDLKMKALEAEIAAIEMESHALAPHAKSEKSGTAIRKVKEQMDELNRNLEEELRKKPNQPPQHNAGSRSTLIDPPASATPSAPSPRG